MKNAFLVRSEAAGGPRQTILNTALKLFAAHGFANVSMRMIAAEIGINAATLYHHFKDKEALYVETLENLYRSIADHLISTLSGPLPARERFEHYVRDFCDFAHRNHDFLKLIKREQLDAEPKHIKLILDLFIRAQIGAATVVLEELLPEQDAVMAAAATHSMVLHHYEALASNRGLTGWKRRHEDPEYVARFILSVILPKG